MSAQEHDPKTDILVQCVNAHCPEVRKPKWMHPDLAMFTDEPVYCGHCGYPTRFIGPNRPKVKPGPKWEEPAFMAEMRAKHSPYEEIDDGGSDD
jgi:hypothetical protein